MKKLLSSHRTRPTLTTIIALIMASAPPSVMYFVLKAEGPLWVLITFSAVVTSLFLLRTLLIDSRVSRSVITGFIAVVTVSGAMAIAIALNLTPASAYIVWFRLIREGAASGTISYMFCLKFTVLTSVFAGLMCTRKIFVSIFGYLFMNAILLAAIYQTDLFVAIASVTFLLFVTYLAISHYKKVKLRALFSSIQVIIVVLLAAWPLSLIDPSDNRSLLIDSVSEESLSTLVIKLFPRFPFLYNMPGYGYTFGERTLGSRPSLTSRPVFKVTGSEGETMYLRTHVYSVYTGRGWAMDTELLSYASAGHRFRDFVKQAPLVRPRNVKELEVLIDFYSSLPHTLSTSFLSMKRKEIPNIQYGSRDVGYLLTDPVTRGQKIFIHEEQSEERNDGTPEGSELDEELIRRKYLQIPERLPERVVREARRIGGEGSDDEKLRRIKTYLNGFSYTLETEAINPDIDAVENFLFSSERGYCVHFATAYALLARINGIPARYSTGFLVNIPYGTNESVVTGYSAHAWPEIWTASTGWTPREATPPMSSEYYDDPDYYEMFGIEGSDYTQLQLEAIMGDRVGALRGGAADHELTLPFAIIGYIAAAIFAVFIVVWTITHSLFFRLSPATKVKFLGRRIISIAEKSGTVSPQNGGWQGWAVSIGGTTPASAVAAQRIARIVQAGFFGGANLRKRDVSYLRIFTSKYLS